MNRPDVAIYGIGMHPFGRHEGRTGLDQGAVAARAALVDAGCRWEDVQFALGGSDAAGKADTLVTQLGLTGLPFTNVANGCATGGSALALGSMAIRSGTAEVVLVVGFDKHPRGAFDPRPEDWGLGEWYGRAGLMLTTQFFGMKATRYLHEHGIGEEVLARVAAKAYRNGALNPNAWRRQPVTDEEVLASPMLSHPLTKAMFCSPAEGAVALVLGRADQPDRFAPPPVRLLAAEMRTRRYGAFEVFSPWLAVEDGPSPSTDAAAAAFRAAGISPADVDVAQVQDTEAGAEVMHLAEVGLCEHGAQGELVMSGATELGGRIPVNTDGGCIANGEPIGASGLRQVHENVVQLRGEAGDRQVGGQPSLAFSHVYGAPGVSACTVLAR